MIIGISGDIGSGKDTLGKIIQAKHAMPYLTPEGVLHIMGRGGYSSDNFQIKKYADKLKNIVCILLNCTREQLEDRTFKESKLSDEWWYYKIPSGSGSFELVPYIGHNKPNSWVAEANPRYLVKMTPRLLLQLLGTECGRKIIHPNIWVNSLMSEYKSYEIQVGTTPENLRWVEVLPKWIITDVRMPNEAQAIKDREGFLIRIERTEFNPDLRASLHESETALDDYDGWDVKIYNHGSLVDLVQESEKIINLIDKYDHTTHF